MPTTKNLPHPNQMNVDNQNYKNALCVIFDSAETRLIIEAILQHKEIKNLTNAESELIEDFIDLIDSFDNSI